MEYLSFGEKLKALRQKRYVTQEQLAAYLEKHGCGTSTKSAISQYENNKRFPDLKSLVILAEYFNVTVDFLVNKISDVNENKLVYQYRELDDRHKHMVIAYSKALCDITN